MKAYVVKRDNCTSDWGRYTDTTIIGYYTNKATAEAVATTIKKDITTYRDGYVEEIEINEN